MIGIQFRHLKIVFFVFGLLLGSVSKAQRPDSFMDLFKIQTFNLFVSQLAVDKQGENCIIDLGYENRQFRKHCRLASAAQKQILDFYAEPPFSILVFKSELITLLQQQSTLEFLKDMHFDLQRGQVDDLWSWVARHSLSQGKPEKTLQLIALLFQDLSGTGYLQLLDTTMTSPSKIAQECLKLMFEMRASLFTIQSVPAELQFKKEGLSPIKLYHFYSIAYLANQVATKIGDPRLGALLPYLFNRTYELGTIRFREGSAYNTQAGILMMSSQGLRNVFYPPNAKSKDLMQVFESDFEGDSIHDIYLGYRAALYGAYLASNRQTDVLSMRDFEKIFRKDPGSISRLFLK